MLIEIDSPGQLTLPEGPCALPPGTRLAEFELLSELGEGGFGIVYLAFDHSLQREVAIKEYLPQAMARRGAGHQVQLLSPAHDDDFALGLKSFVNEARTLAQFDHPALLKVFRFWQGNGTAYMATPVYRGQTLQAHRLALGRAPNDAEVRAVMLPLLQALQVLHEADVLHGDVAPDNILIDTLGQPVLLDFGAARQVLQAQGATPDAAMLKPAYAAPERHDLSLAHGPSSDLYSLGASLYFMLMGTPPPRATVRALHDTLEPLPPEVLRGCDPALLREIDRMLALDPPQRPNSAREVWTRLRKLPHADEVTALARPAAAAATVMANVVEAQGWESTAAQTLDSLPMPKVRRRPLGAALLGGLVVLLVVVLGGFLLLRPAAQEAAVATPASAVAAPLAAAPVAASSPTPASAISPQAEVSAVATVPAAMPVAAASAVAAAPAISDPAATAAPKPGAGPGRTAGARDAAAPSKAAAARLAPGAAAGAALPVLPAASLATPGAAQVAPVQPAAPAGPASPRAACSQEAFLFREVCMERQCGKSEWRAHPQCVQMRELQEANQRNREGG